MRCLALSLPIVIPLLLAGGCAAGDAQTCVQTSDCIDGFVCVDGLCRMPGTPLPDGGVVSECRVDDECTEGVCLEGVCCAVEQACGDVCCGAGQTCFANACVVPGEPCLLATDCADGEYCEPALGDGPQTGGGEGPGMCLAPPPTGRCVALPPTCDESLPAGTACVRECEFRPAVGNLNAVEQWRWGPGAVSERPNDVDVWSTPVVGRVYDTNCDGSVDTLDPPNIIFVAGDLQRVPLEDGTYVGTCCHCGHERGTSTPILDGCRRGVLRVLDGRTGAELMTVTAAVEGGRGFAGFSPALGDVDHDGQVEIVAVTYEGRIAVVEADGSISALSEQKVELFTSGPTCETDSDCPQTASGGFTYDCFENRCVSYIAGWGGGLALADMDGDGSVEVALGRMVFTIAAEGGSITRRFVGAGHQASVHSLSYFVDLGENADLELLAGPTAYRADGSMMWHREGLADGFTAVGDLGGEAGPEVVLVNGGAVTVLDGATGATRIAATVAAGTGGGGPPTLADFDGDGRPEIGVAKRDFYTVLRTDEDNTRLTELWSTPNHDLSSSVTGSTVFDFEGDGVAEVVYNDECFLWVYDGPTGNVRFATPLASFTGTEASLVADVDGDGKAELIVFANGADPRSPEGWRCEAEPWNGPGADGVRPAWRRPEGQNSWRGLWVMRDVSNSWVGTRPLWNQHSYSVSNVCEPGDDACAGGLAHGAIPERRRSNWTVPWLNNFRQNVQQEGLFDAPDATVTLAADCSAPVTLEATVRNLGQAMLPEGVEVGFYVVEDGGERLIGTASTDTALFPSQGTVVRLALPTDASLTVAYRARILIDAAAPTFRECFDDNNQSEDLVPPCLLM